MSAAPNPSVSPLAEALGPEVHILLVEDDPAQAVAMTRWLETQSRYRVEAVSSGLVAVDLLQSATSWDVIISDIDLPGMSGLEFLDACAAHQPETPVIMITAHRKFDYAVTALQKRAERFLLKPLGRQRLLDEVGTVLEEANAKARAARSVVLAIGAHPDDVEIGVGGILLNHARRGDEVHILTLTGGEAGGPRSTRVVESRAAAESIGATLELHALPDRSVSEGPETISVIEAAIRKVQPTVIYTHSINDAHQDHRAAHRATLVAARGVPDVFCYQAPSTTVDFRPQLFIDISSQVERKLSVLEHYATQTSIRPYLRPAHVSATAEYWGRYSGYRAVEPLEVVRKSA